MIKNINIKKKVLKIVTFITINTLLLFALVFSYEYQDVVSILSNNVYAASKDTSRDI